MKKFENVPEWLELEWNSMGGAGGPEWLTLPDLAIELASIESANDDYDPDEIIDGKPNAHLCLRNPDAEEIIDKGVMDYNKARKQAEQWAVPFHNAYLQKWLQEHNLAEFPENDPDDAFVQWMKEQRENGGA